MDCMDTLSMEIRPGETGVVNMSRMPDKVDLWSRVSAFYTWFLIHFGSHFIPSLPLNSQPMSSPYHPTLPKASSGELVYMRFQV